MDLFVSAFRDLSSDCESGAIAEELIRDQIIAKTSNPGTVGPGRLSATRRASCADGLSA